MVEYNCSFCHYKTDRKQSILEHLRRKIPCSHVNNKDYVYFKDLDLYICRLCGYETDTYINVYQHLLSVEISKYS